MLVVALMIAGLENSFVIKANWRTQYEFIVKPVVQSGGTLGTFICTERNPPSHNISEPFRDELNALEKNFNVVKWIRTDEYQGQIPREQLLYKFVTAHEKEKGPTFRFSHIIRMRPDLVWSFPLSLETLHPRRYHSRARKLMFCPSRQTEDTFLSYHGCGVGLSYRKSNPLIGSQECASRGFDGFDTCALLDDQFGVVPRVLSDLVFDPLHSLNNVSTKQEIDQIYGKNRTMEHRCHKNNVDPNHFIEGRNAKKMIFAKQIPFEINGFSFHVDTTKKRRWRIHKPSNATWIC
jgi:hypothetical protein